MERAVGEGLRPGTQARRANIDDLDLVSSSVRRPARPATPVIRRPAPSCISYQLRAGMLASSCTACSAPSSWLSY